MFVYGPRLLAYFVQGSLIDAIESHEFLRRAVESGFGLNILCIARRCFARSPDLDLRDLQLLLGLPFEEPRYPVRHARFPDIPSGTRVDVSLLKESRKLCDGAL